MPRCLLEAKATDDGAALRCEGKGCEIAFLRCIAACVFYCNRSCFELKVRLKSDLRLTSILLEAQGLTRRCEVFS